MADKLAPCPFCGASDVVIEEGGEWSGSLGITGHCYFGKCLYCHAEGPTTEVGDAKQIKVAAILWNNRRRTQY